MGDRYTFGSKDTDHTIEIAHTGDIGMIESYDRVDEDSWTGQDESGKCGKTFRSGLELLWLVDVMLLKLYKTITPSTNGFIPLSSWLDEQCMSNNEQRHLKSDKARDRRLTSENKIKHTATKIGGQRHDMRSLPHCNIVSET